MTKDNHVVLVTAAGERILYSSTDLVKCYQFAVRENRYHGFHGGVRVVEQFDGVRVCAFDCAAAMSQPGGLPIGIDSEGGSHD